ncbi:MAG: dihydropteroate synthase [Phycisphaerae bacterium]|nr:dihydropteroate synthase [Saprospiraceae bacterium]
MSNVQRPTSSVQHPTSINCKGQLLDLSRPVVMGILNVTPDSFFDGGQYLKETTLLQQAEKMLREGASILDIGGASSRPGAIEVSESEEMRRTLPGIEAILKNFPNTIVSVDTWRANVASAAVQAGASIVNDISAGNLDPKMLETVATLGIPYVLMHMQGTPDNMQKSPDYEDVVTEVLDFFVQKIETLHGLGVKDILLDPGFGFGKTVEHNFSLLKNLHVFQNVLGLPILAGLSRKSMICKPLGIKPAEALNGTTALHMVALQQGSSILRVHDVREAVEVIRMWELVK